MSTVRVRLRRIAVAAALPALAPAALWAQSLAYVGGLQYAAGDFVSNQRTWSAYLSNGLSWSGNRLRAAVSVPLVMQPAEWLQYGAGNMMSAGGMSHSRVGIGDPIGRIDVALFRPAASHPSLSLVGAVKAPLADVGGGFGTGEWDVGVGLSSTVHVGSTSVFADAVYWKLGNPAGASLRNAVAYAVSAGRALPRSRWSILGTVLGASSLWTGQQAPVQAGMGVGYLLESGSSVIATVAAGLTRTAPAVSTGLGWRVPLGRAR